LCHGPVVTYCMVYHYTKRATLARLLANEGPAIYVVHLNRYFCYTSMILFSSHFSVTVFMSMIPMIEDLDYLKNS